jgi:hypothetical protein
MPKWGLSHMCVVVLGGFGKEVENLGEKEKKTKMKSSRSHGPLEASVSLIKKTEKKKKRSMRAL